MNKTAIEWTDYSSNPVYAIDTATGKRGWHCTKASPGCAHCYAETLNKRWGTGRDYTPANDRAVEWVLNEAELTTWLAYERAATLGKKPPMRMFIGDMTDLFHPAVPTAALRRIWGYMAACPHIIFQVLTKRPARMREVAVYNSENGPLPNVWLGTSVENQHWADVRIPALLQTPAVVRFLSMEPLLGGVDLAAYLWEDAGPAWAGANVADPGLGWVIVGGESGAGHRPFNPDWARAIRDQCQEAGVPFLFKQHGGRTPRAGGRLLDGQEYNGFPEVAA